MSLEPEGRSHDTLVLPPLIAFRGELKFGSGSGTQA